MLAAIVCIAKEDLGQIIITLLGLGAFLLIYFLPAYIGKDKANATAILMLNLFLGWTFVGWVVALVWACTVERERKP